MRETVRIDENGCIRLGLATDKSYIVTKWYGSSLAVFEEDAFQKYLRKLDTLFWNNNHGRSVIRYFLSAAVTVMPEGDEGWLLPEALMAVLEKDGDPIERYALSDDEGTYQGSLPLLLLAAQSNMENAIRMTAERHG